MRDEKGKSFRPFLCANYFQFCFTFHPSAFILPRAGIMIARYLDTEAVCIENILSKF
jgi:hypothetical protein